MIGFDTQTEKKRPKICRHIFTVSYHVVSSCTVNSDAARFCCKCGKGEDISPLPGPNSVKYFNYKHVDEE